MGSRASSNHPLIRAMSRAAPPARRFALLRLRRAARRAEARRAASARIVGAPVPEALVISLTSRCPGSCGFCLSAGRQGASDLEEALAMRLLREAEELGVFAIVLAGGEPLLRRDLALRMVESHPRLLFLLFTGGQGMSPEVARRARAPNLLTLVGADADRTCGEPARHELRRAGAAFGFSAVVARDTAERLSSREFVERLRLEGARFGVFFERLPIGRAASLGFGLRPGSRERFRKAIRRIEREAGLPLRFYPEGEEEFGGCVAGGRGVLHVNSEGDVEPCPFIHVSRENLRDRPLAEILRSPFLASIRDLASRGRRGMPCALLHHPELSREGPIGDHTASAIAPS